jgi:hypothetical protein
MQQLQVQYKNYFTRKASIGKGNMLVLNSRAPPALRLLRCACDQCWLFPDAASPMNFRRRISRVASFVSFAQARAAASGGIYAALKRHICSTVSRFYSFVVTPNSKAPRASSNQSACSHFKPAETQSQTQGPGYIQR